MTSRKLAAALCLALTLGLSACGESDESSAPAAPVSPTAKASANDASAEELTAVFEARGIPSAEQWAEEVEEYRPHPAEDRNFTKLREELAKYDPPPGVVDRIVAALEL